MEIFYRLHYIKLVTIPDTFFAQNFPDVSVSLYLIYM